MKASNLIAAGLVLAAGAAYSAPSHAATAYRIAINHASAACMGSMDFDRAMTRARSMGLSNIDTGLSDVRCGGVSTPYNNNGDVEIFETSIRNSGTTDVDVNCSLADGVEDGIFTVSTKYPKSVFIPAGGLVWIDWTTADNGGQNFIYPSMSCQLPKDVAISYTAIIYQVDVGQ